MSTWPSPAVVGSMAVGEIVHGVSEEVVLVPVEYRPALSLPLLTPMPPSAGCSGSIKLFALWATGSLTSISSVALYVGIDSVHPSHPAQVASS